MKNRENDSILEKYFERVIIKVQTGDQSHGQVIVIKQPKDM